jgi:SAM-dependent methyltransferase
MAGNAKVMASHNRFLEDHHRSAAEKGRTEDLLSLIPSGHTTVLDAGARDGYYSALLAQRFDSVTSLDLLNPPLTMERVLCVQGDITSLDFPDRFFDIVFCTEVLEHVPALEKACAELMRVANHVIIVGVPYRHDIRISRTTCGSCGKIGPPWGHVNSFDEAKLERLFQPWITVKKNFVGVDREKTNALAAWLMDLGGNPWGVYENQTCIHCGGPLAAPENRSLMQKVFAATALRLAKLTTKFSQPHGNWIHIVFQRNI